jgi:hypothetical protein
VIELFKAITSLAPLSRHTQISHGRRVVFLNASDIEMLGLQRDQWVDLTSYFESETRRAERFK